MATQRRTRRPTGKASWPMLLLAGREKCGKTYTAAQFSGSDLVGATYFIEIGEGSADPYAGIPGADFLLVEHDGSWADILAAVEWVVEQPPAGGLPSCLIIDSMTELWGLLGDEQDSIAAKRGKSTITMDQWNSAKKRWRKVIDAARKMRGPVIMTARYNEVSVIEAGKPTERKQWKVDAEKNLAYEVDGIITWQEARQPWVQGIRTVAFDVPKGGFAPKDPPNFRLDDFFRALKIDGAERRYIARAEDPDAHTPAPDAIMEEAE